jgi:hypothetical protein
VRVQSAFAYVVITLYDRLFQAVRLAAGLITLWFYTDARPTTPSPPQNSDKCLVSSDQQNQTVCSSLFTRHSSLLGGKLGLGSSAFARRY